MEIESWIIFATETLAKAGSETARLDSLVLIEDVLGKDRSWLLAHPTDSISKKDLNMLNKFIVQRSNHYPVAYITHKAYFYNNQFYVDNHVLVPRPESEAIIDVLKTLPSSNLATIIDIGTGSGVIAITAKLLYPKSTVFALDIDTQCLKVARKNALSTKTDITFLQSDLLESLPANLAYSSIVLANLPYVPDGFAVNRSARLEPKLAIFGGSKGLDVYSRLFQQIVALTTKPAHVITESFPVQHPQLQSIAWQAGYSCQATNDFIQLFSLPA
jgi:release factor glutamine methyltransferase